MAVSQSLKLYQGTQDVVSNSSKLRILWKSTQSGQSYNNNSRTAKYWVSVNGGAETEYSVTYTLPKSATKTILDVTITVPHDDYGNCTVSVRTWMDTRISAGEVELSEEITLTPILRAHTISAADAYIGGVLTVSVARKSADYYNSVHYQFGTLSGYMDGVGGTAVFEARSKTSEYLFNIPADWDTQIPNAKSGVCTLTCKTYLGTDLIGTTTTTVNIKTNGTFAPQISAEVVDINENSIALTGNAAKLIRGVSTARATLTAIALRGASIKSTYINGVKTAALELEAVQSGGFTFRAVDSRGWETTQTMDLDIIPYIPLSAIVETVRGAQGGNALAVTVKGNYYPGSFGAVANTLTVQVKADDGAWQVVDTTIDGNTYTAEIELDLDYQTEHRLYFNIADKVKSLSPSRYIPKAIPTMMEGEDWVRFNVPITYRLNHDNYIGRADANETGLEAWLDGLMDVMPNYSTRQIMFVCKAVTGSTVAATLYKYDGDYASVLGHSYDGGLYQKTKYGGTWGATVKR